MIDGMQQASAHQNLVDTRLRSRPVNLRSDCPAFRIIILARGWGRTLLEREWRFLELTVAWVSETRADAARMPLGCRPLESRTSQAEGVA